MLTLTFDFQVKEFVRNQASDYYEGSSEGIAIQNNATFLQMYVDLIFQGDDRDKDGFIDEEEFNLAFNNAAQNKKEDSGKEAGSKDEL